MAYPILFILLLLACQPILADDRPHDTKTSFSSSNNHRLEQDSLFNVIAAEFGLYRDQYDQSLDFYLTESIKQQSPYLAERATRIAMHQQRYPDMLNAAKIWHKNTTDNTMSLFFTSLAYSLNLQPALAMEYMRKVLQLGGDTDFTRLVNSMREGHASETFYINELQQADQQHKNNIDISLALALLYQRNAEQALSLEHMETAINSATLHTKASSAVIGYAVRFYLRYDMPQQALAVYKHAVQQSPEDSQLRHSYAQLALRYNLAEAKEQFQYLLGQFPRDDFIILSLALIYLEEENFNTAEEMLSLLLTLQKRKSSAHYYMGQIYYMRQDYNAAINSLSKVTATHDADRAQEQIIKIYIETNDFAAAEDLLNIALSNTENTERTEKLHILQATILKQQGHIAEAYQLLTQLVSNNPDSIELRYNRAMIAETENQLPEMELDLRHIIKLKPDNALALNALGYTLADKTNRYNEALQLIQQAHQLVPDDPAILDSLGWVLYRMGRLSEAANYLHSALNKLPDAEVAAHLGEVLWALGQKDDAQRILQKALNASPDHSTLNETIKRLNVPL